MGRLDSRRGAWVLAALVALGAGLRLWRLGALPPGLFYDEAVNGVDVRMVLTGHGFPLYFAANNGREPLFIYLQALSVALLGYRPIALRLVSALVGALTIPAVYFCARAFLTAPTAGTSAVVARENSAEGRRPIPWAALIAAGGLAVSYWAVSLSRLGLRAVMLPLTAGLAFGCLWLAWNSTRRRLYVWAGAWFAIGLYTYTAARSLLLAPLAFVLFELLAARIRGERSSQTFRRRLTGAIVMGLTCLVLAIPLGIAAWQDPAAVLGRPDAVSLLAAPPPGEQPAPPLQRLAGNLALVARNFYDRGDLDVRHNLPGRPANDPLLALLFSIGLLACLLALKTPRPRLLLVWLLVALLPTLLSGEAPHSLRAAGALPVLAVLYGAGAQTIVGLVRHARLRSMAPPALLALLILTSGGLTTNDYFRRWALLPQLGDTFGLRDQLGAEATVRRLAPGSGSDALLISNDLLIQPQMVFALGLPEITLDFPATLPSAPGFVLETPFDPTQPLFLLWAGERGPRAVPLAPLRATEVDALLSLQNDGSETGVVRAAGHQEGWPQVLVGDLPPGVPLAPGPIAVPLDVKFENNLRLIGYDVQPPADVDGPRRARVTTFWRCDAGADPRAQRAADVFLHLVHDGAVWQTENHPLPASYLLAWPGTCSILVDSRRVTLPAGIPSGKSYFETGLFRPTSAYGRIPILNPYEQGASDQVLIAPFVVDDAPPLADLHDLHPLDVRFDGRIELAGWRVVQPKDPPAVLQVDLAWRALERTGTNYTAFLHLIDANGNILAQHDAPPGGAANPTSLWALGETVRSTLELTLPAGSVNRGLRLRVGLYQPSTGRQAAVGDLPAVGGATSGGTYLLLPLDEGLAP